MIDIHLIIWAYKPIILLYASAEFYSILNSEVFWSVIDCHVITQCFQLCLCCVAVLEIALFVSELLWAI